MKIIILSILCGILLLISFILFIQNYKLKKDARALTESIDEFRNQGKATQISLYDNDFARLQNAVGDLEELVNLEKGKLYNENKKNVQFISDISHQLKTPIAALRLYCEMDLASGENAHAQKELELIDKTEQLIYKLLKLEKVTDGRRCFDVPFVPRRCGSLRFRLKGRGQLTLRSLTRTSAAAKGGILAQEVN